MELTRKKTGKIVVCRTCKKDIESILHFHQKHFAFSLPAHLKNTLEGLSGLSLAAYKDNKLIGHILLIPLTSQRNIALEEAILLTGLWSLSDEVSEQLLREAMMSLREAMMSAWESGFHAVFSLENHHGLKKAGFELVKKDFFAIDLSKYSIYGMELSWNGFNIIPEDLTIPKTYLPPIKNVNDFSTN